MIKLDSRKKIYFIGIGGISMSGLARIMLSRGHIVSGSDSKDSNIINKLRNLGAKVYIGHKEENMDAVDLVVYTAAISKDNPEYKKAIRVGIPMLERAEFLGYIMKSYKYSINVSGTHGKTTTTSMIGAIMLEDKFDPTIHVGGELDEIGGNTLIGKSEYFITEACEYVDSFLKFYPYVALVLNIDKDHLDYFSGINAIKESFYKFVSLVPSDGYIVGCLDDKNVKDILNRELRCKNVITYAINNDSAKWRATNITFDEDGCGSFTLVKDGLEYCDVDLNVKGMHNILNAVAACSVCFELGVKKETVVEVLRKFKGAHRRYEYKGEKNNVKVIDDYAHHPSEIKATLEASRKSNFNKEWCIFQPHTYTRTKELLDEFSEAFYGADNVIVTDIYAAREKDTGEINSSILVDKLKKNNVNAVYIKDFDDIVDYLDENVSDNDLILTMGAGDIYMVGEKYLNE